MRINHNIAALNTYRQLTQNNTQVQNSLEKLSSGLRINRAADDAAGLAISEKMRAQIRGLEQAQQNAQDGISLIQTAEGALNETHSILQRMSELAVQSANDTNTDSDRVQLQKEIDQLSQELTRISRDTEFNTQKLLDGGFEGTFHIGANEGQSITISIGDASAEALNVAEEISGGSASSSSIGDMAIGDTYTVVSFDEAIDVGSSGSAVTANYGLQNSDGDIVAVSANGESYSILTSATAQDGLSSGTSVESTSISFGSSNPVTRGTVTVSDDGSGQAVFTATQGISIDNQADANAAISIIDDAIETVSSQRSKLGAYQNRLEHTINNLGTSSENLTAAESRIRDVDMAQEMMAFTKNNILTQAAQAMLAQANQLPQGVLQLLR